MTLECTQYTRALKNTYNWPLRPLVWSRPCKIIYVRPNCCQLCYRPVLAAQECASGVLSSPVCAVLQTDDPRMHMMNMQVRAINTTVNYVCRENIEGIYL